MNNSPYICHFPTAICQLFINYLIEKLLNEKYMENDKWTMENLNISYPNKTRNAICNFGKYNHKMLH